MSEPVTAKAAPEPLVIGRYALFDALASGGMATVHLGRRLDAEGGGRTVAVKRLHAHYTRDQDFVTMFMDEARIVARIRHPNVVPMVDLIESNKGLLLVMEYVHGESFSKLLRTCRAMRAPTSPRIVAAILRDVLIGLHAAHETKGASGELLDVVHRDVSPQNIMVGADGAARVLDFGVAKAAGRAQVTREGQIKGKLAYMAPEQIRGKVDRRSDVFAAAIVLWEALAGRRFYDGAKDVEIVTRVVKGQFDKPSDVRADSPRELDAIVMRGLEVDPSRRYQTALEMAIDLERRIGLASVGEISAWVKWLASEALDQRADRVAAMEKAASLLPVAAAPRPAPSDPAMSELASLHGDTVASRCGAGDGLSTTGTPLGTELPAPTAPRRQDLAAVALLSFSGALALVGVVLVAVSLYARSHHAATAAAAAPPSAESTMTSAEEPAEIATAAPDDAPPDDATRARDAGASDVDARPTTTAPSD